MRLLTALLCAAVAWPVAAADYYVGPEGKRENPGTREAPWEIANALGGGQPLQPGDTLWLLPGTYKAPGAKEGSMGYEVHLSGTADKPVVIRGIGRATIDGGLIVKDCSNLWLRELEVLVSEPRPTEPVDENKGYATGRPWGGVNVYQGVDCKFINLVIHDNSQGISWWSEATGDNQEVHGCIIYDNGWQGVARGHGHAIYTQNKEGRKSVTDNIMTGGFSYSMHGYGSSRAFIKNYTASGNIVYNAGQFLIGGGSPSVGIQVQDNYLYNTSMRMGYGAQNEDLTLVNNTVVNEALAINKWNSVKNEGNLLLAKDAARPADPVVVLRPNKYDPNRANLAIFNWDKSATEPVDLSGFLKPGDKFRLQNPRDFYGAPVLEGTYQGGKIDVPTTVDGTKPAGGEFAAYVLLRTP